MCECILKAVSLACNQRGGKKTNNVKTPITKAKLIILNLLLIFHTTIKMNSS
jgi:hypothetical protein